MMKQWRKALGMLLAMTIALTALAGLSFGSVAETADGDDYRNIALYRAVYQSSAYNYNDTGHLVTDGIRSTLKMNIASASAQYDDSPAAESPACAIDGDATSKWLTFHSAAWLQVSFSDAAVTAQKYSVTSAADAPLRDPKSWTLQGSVDGVTFTDIDTQVGQSFASRKQEKIYTIANPGAYAYYRLNITENNGDTGTDGNTNPRIQLAEFDLLNANENSLVRDEGNATFTSLWRSKTDADEWVYVDLGVESEFHTVILNWNDTGFATAYDIQISDDAKEWNTIYTVTDGKGGEETLTFDTATARYLRLFCRETAADIFALSELEVYGINDLTYSVGEMPAAEADGTQKLTGGNWTVQRASEVDATGEQLASAYDDAAWLPATVPGTVLTSYLNAGAIPDPNIADQQLMISDSYFTTNWWYRNQFEIPESQRGRRVWLNFDAINWKADVYFNGQNIGKIEGAFIRGRFDVTDLVNYGGENYLAVYIHMNDNPGDVTLQDKANADPNGGILGADNPTIHASIGWDWMPTIRGRNVGIYEDVYLSYSQDVTLSDPWAITDLDVENKDFSKADVTVKTIVCNPSDKEVTTVVKGTITPGNIALESDPITLAAGESKEIVVDTVTMQDPAIWWPNTYGEQPLYTASLESVVDGELSDTRSFNFGVREFTYHTDKPLEIYCNGTRIICRGGNWGMDDSNLAATEEDYDIKVRMHAEANFTMIRNWVGMTNHKAFYDACDKYGILIWDDFWLANPGDGPNPNDEEMFMNNVRDKILRNRHHAALALYCGRNEGNPPASLDAGFKAETTALDGTRHYISHSASGTVSGYGPYAVRNPKWYFETTYETLHSERGLPNIPSYESMLAMLTEEHAWPIDDVWGMHDFTEGSAQNGNDFEKAMKKYGSYDSLEDFVRTAQMVNYENHKAMFEAMYTSNSNGLLMWMSQSSWPSMVWQTYDYYYDTNAGYFAIKKANQPINLILNQSTNELWMSNATPYTQEDLTFTLTVYDMNGQFLHSTSTTQTLASDEQKVWKKMPGFAGATDILYICTTVTDKDGNPLADNFTWINRTTYQDYDELNTLSEVTLSANKGEFVLNGNTVTGQITLQNDSDAPALMIRLKSLDENGERVLPVYYDDNYISLMPGESRTVTLEFDRQYLTGSELTLAVEGWNITAATVATETIPMEASSYMAGDVELDGDVDANDALMALQASTQKIALNEQQKTVADVNGDRQVTANDALMILQSATKKINL